MSLVRGAVFVGVAWGVALLVAIAGIRLWIRWGNRSKPEDPR